MKEGGESEWESVRGLHNGIIKQRVTRGILPAAGGRPPRAGSS